MEAKMLQNTGSVSTQRNYKDTMFRLIFKEKKNLLSLYNAVNDTHYEDAEQLEIVTFISIVKEFRKEKIGENAYIYEVQIQDIRFRTAMSDEELKGAGSCIIDMLEELKNINNSGVNRTRLMEIENGFMLRGIMQMNSNEIEENKDME